MTYASTEECVNAAIDFPSRTVAACDHPGTSHDEDGCRDCTCQQYRTDGADD